MSRQSQIQQLFPVLFGGGKTISQRYDARVLAQNPLLYYKLNETSGTSAIDYSGNGYHGTYSGVTLASANGVFSPDKMPLWDGVNDFLNFYTAGFAGAFNPDEFSMLLWFQVSAGCH